MASTNRKQELLNAAYAAIAEHGVRGLRVEEVAARAGVAVSLVYYHFESRDGLLRASMQYADATSASTVMLLADPGGRPAYDRLETALLAELGSGKKTRDNNVVWHEILATAVFDDELRELVAEETNRWVGQVATVIDEGTRDGSIRSDVNPKHAARLLTTLLDGAILEWLSGSVGQKAARDLVKDAIRERLKP